MRKAQQKIIAICMLILAMLFAFWLKTQETSFVWHWALGLSLGFVLQRSRICFVSAATEPFITGST